MNVQFLILGLSRVTLFDLLDHTSTHQQYTRNFITLDFILKRYTSMKLSKSRPMLLYETRGESVTLNKNSKRLKYSKTRQSTVHRWD